MMVISEDHSSTPVVHGAGESTLTRQQIGTRYVMVLSVPLRTRTICRHEGAHALQDRIQVDRRMAASSRCGLGRGFVGTVVTAECSGGDQDGHDGDVRREVEAQPDRRLTRCGLRLGRQSEGGGRLSSGMAKLNDGKIRTSSRCATFRWTASGSVTVYNARAGHGAESAERVLGQQRHGQANADGSVTIDFGGDPRSAN